MINYNEKIQIIDNRLLIIEDMINSCNADIERIQNGMVDPDLTLEECGLFLNDLLNKKQALLEEKQALTN